MIPKRTEEIDVDFTITCDDFRVAEWPGLRCSATFRVVGTVEVDHSGDHITPDGPPTPNVNLIDPTEYTICHEDEPLPDWLQERLVMEDATEFDAAFLDAIGGQVYLDSRAIERVT